MASIAYWRAGLGFALLAVATATAAAADKPDIAKLKAGPVVVVSKRITAFKRFGTEQPLAKVTFRGGLELSSPSPFFGGWSALLLDDAAQNFVAISDAGEWLTGSLIYDGIHPAGVQNVRLGPLLESDGRPIKRSRNRDAESAALASGGLQRGSVLIGFEGNPRITRYQLSPDVISPSGGNLTLPPAAKTMRPNQGFEALTVLRGGPFKGSTLAFSERLFDLRRNHTGWLWTGDGPRTVHLKNIGDYDIADISSLDDGTLFVLERRFRWTEGLKVRLRRVAPEDLAPDQTSEGEILLEADLNDQIDNMEGLSVTRLETGEILITMISDDNFNHLLQRTLLLQFVTKESRQAKARPSH
ncbi:esterase-like activity of phytase family protein [Hyphomicrobium sp.]|uniref:esterase-like activity of phytase family protein n=1 Tax=Hyphomicrobium sp. TaxID=82 RepID=UPI002D7964EB|nr:esterase-like activity of phytase family protein [Hyphomicrobium sp.]HET6391116.1 esterase-like activity of phytase family protein [Hyphomicrobium sp.]